MPPSKTFGGAGSVVPPSSVPAPASASQASAPASNDQPQMRHLELLLRVAKEVAAHDTLEEMLRNIVSVSAEETGAERGTLFLHDERSGELYSRVAQGTTLREIRILSDAGVAGNVFTTAVGAIVHDPYSDPRFNQKVDQETGFVTKSILCAPIR